MTETCDQCGFDGARWRAADARSLLGALPTWWAQAVDGVARLDLNRRPAPGVWSALEYGGHSAVVTAMLRWAIDEIAAGRDVVMPEESPVPDASPDDPAADLDPAAIQSDLARESAAIVAAECVPAAEHLLLHAAHDASHHMMDVGRGLADLGLSVNHTGRVVQVNASGGGVPKQATEGGAVDHNGLAGDRQANRKHHGRQFQALCLWSTEVLAELASLGHPIGPGCAGENLTVSGVDWPAMRPGTRLRIGSVLAEISFPSTPCAKQSGWFTDGDFRRIHHDVNPQWTRWYAWVREPGEIRPGDTVGST